MTKKETVDFLTYPAYSEKMIKTFKEKSGKMIQDIAQYHNPYSGPILRLNVLINRFIVEFGKEQRKDGFFGAREYETVGWGGVAKGVGPVYHTFDEFEEKRNE